MKLTDGSDSYIIRIYRYVNDSAREIVGTAEKVGGEEKLGFTTIDDLWKILNSRFKGETGEKRARRRQEAREE